MALSIKNSRAERLARQLATETGESLTQAVLHSLEERFEKIKGRRTAPDLVGTILSISARCSALPDLDDRSPEAILGYDQHGAFD